MKISYAKATDSLYFHLIESASVDSDEVADGEYWGQILINSAWLKLQNLLTSC